MPAFDYDCDACGWFGDVICAVAFRDSQECPECQHAVLTRRFLRGATPIGALHSKPIDYSKQCGVVCETNAEARAFEAKMEADGFRLYSRSDSSLQNLLFGIRNRKDKTAVKQGYRDNEHRNRMVKAGVLPV